MGICIVAVEHDYSFDREKIGEKYQYLHTINIFHVILIHLAMVGYWNYLCKVKDFCSLVCIIMKLMH